MRNEDKDEAFSHKAWLVMQQWQDMMQESPDEASAMGMFVLLADSLLHWLAFRNQWSHETVILHWYKVITPYIVETVEERWSEEGDEDEET
jgi:hypothetical protein